MERDDRFYADIRRQTAAGRELISVTCETSSGRESSLCNIPSRVRVFLVLCIVIAYAVSFPCLYNSAGAIVAAFTIVPVSAAGTLLGVRGGLFTGLLCIPLNMILFSLVDVSGYYMLVRFWPGTLTYLAAGVTVGWLRDLVLRLNECSRELSIERQQLQHEISERREVEAALQKASIELEQLVDERSAQLEDAGSVLVHETTERRRAEEMLRANEQLYRSLVETSPYAITLLDIGGAIVMANPEALKLYGETSLDQVFGCHLMEWVAPEDRIRASELFVRLVAGEVMRNVTLRMVRRDHPPFWAEFCASRINMQGVRDDLLLIHSSDVTERKRAEEALRTSHEALRSLGAHLETVRENERKTIAQEIHDELGQSLTAMKYDISWLGKRLPTQDRMIAERIASLGEAADATIRTVQRISSKLRPKLLDDLGLTAAIEWKIQEFVRRTGIRCNMAIDLDGVSPNQQSSLTLYRILQEALTNIIRHAAATEIDVTLTRQGGALFMCVADNGRGITEQESAASNAFGLMGMRERAHICGGELSIAGAAGNGTTIQVLLPLQRQENGRC